MADIISNVVTHPFDEKGVLPENYILNEKRELPNRDVRAVRPRGGAIFIDTFVMRDANGVVVDPSKYEFGLFSDVISRKLNRTICGVVLLTDKTVPQPVYIDYRCVGGPWGASNEVIIDMFYQVQQDGRPVDYGNIFNLPDGFVPAHHFQDIGDLYGAEYWVAAMDRLAQAILMGDKASHDEIIRSITANNNSIDDKLVQLGTSLKQYVDQQDAAINRRIDLLTQQTSVSLQQLTNRMDAMELSAGQQGGIVESRLSYLERELSRHVDSRGNVHGLTAALLDVYTKEETDQKISSSGQDLSDYVKKDANENLSLSFREGQLTVYKDGEWKIVWPAQWS